MSTLLGMSGSLRKDSLNTKLVHEAARLFAPERFVFADLDLPLFNEDVEAAGIPEKVSRLMDQVAGADALLISTPEYNKGPPGVLKNALDWLSRRKPMPTAGKPVAVVSAAAGMAGGQRATSALYLMLVAFDVRFVFNPEVSVGAAASKFDADGRLTDPAALKFLDTKMELLRANI